ncbi:SGNH/GDSL hydrolase family protein [Kitasatospora sp. NPDC050543]|uniref:SGNH/GDSL hydrolase family protein n=1 Tax=Kitasatospora sp. NPDC050543 TaxID=3364054 RepID=UPI00378D090E
MGATAAVALALALAGCSGGAASPGPGPVTSSATPPPPSGPYAALGDSYTAGLKIAPQVGEPRGCARSGANYPSLVAKELGLAEADFRDVSCSAARTVDLTGAQKTDGGQNPPQLDALSEATRLVTLGIGGNDAGFMEVIGECARDNLVKAVVGAVTERAPGGAPCRDHYMSGGSDQLRGRMDAAGERLGGLLREIRRRAPQARVYLVGYPSLLPADPAACAPVLGKVVTAGDLGFLTEKERELNAMLKRQAEAAGAGFVDTAAPSAGHDMCADEASRWIEPPFPAPGLAPVHPNARGQQGVAAAVLKAVRG